MDGAVDWAAVGYVLGTLLKVVAIFILMIVLAVVAIVVVVSWHLSRETREAKERERRNREIAKPRIPETLSYRQQEGLRQYNTVIRPDHEDLENLRNTD